MYKCHSPIDRYHSPIDRSHSPIDKYHSLIGSRKQNVEVYLVKMDMILCYETEIIMDWRNGYEKYH